MRKRIFSPIFRLTIAMLGITLALVLCAHALKIMPDAQAEAFSHRKRTVEALTVQLSSQVMLDDLDAIVEVLDAVVERNPEVLSAALRDPVGAIVVESGDHEQFWQEISDGRSTAEFVRVPIYFGEDEVAVLEVRFEKLPSPWILSLEHGGVMALLLFVALGGGAGYFLVLRRSLRALDPSAVIPERVSLALDTLVEGVIIIDENEQVLLANRAFGGYLDVPVKQLVGKRASELNWRSAETGGSAAELPWIAAMAKRTPVTDHVLELRAADQKIRVFTVNATPILDPRGRLCGALASFGDITELRQQNADLQRTLVELEQSRQAIEKHNAELSYLATRDPLTGCLNRRSFFESFERAFEAARASKEPLCCAMIDIDHFKQINDRFGHATGDRIIAFVAETIRLHLQNNDFVGRYGGEEYAVVFPSRRIEEAAAIIERIRDAITSGASPRFASRLKLTVSSGVAHLSLHDLNYSMLLERADVSLYAAKARGRNRVVCWTPELKGAEAARQRTPKPDLSGTWKGVPRDKDETGLHRMPPAADLMGAFRERVAQTLSLAARHNWTAALLRIELESAGALKPRAQREVLERIAALLRRSDTLAMLLGERAGNPDTEGLPSTSSLGPGELGVLLPDIKHVNAIGRVVQRLVEIIGEPVVIDGRETLVGCAIGISVAPLDGEDFDTLMHRAEHARRVVRKGRSAERYAFYQASMTETLLETMRIENGLRRALERDEFKLVYQPQVELATGRVSGFEALLRWNDADGTAIRPDQFIPIAESSGLIVAIGDWVLHMACAQALSWQRATGIARRVAVNVSAVQIMAYGFAERVAAILRTAQVDPRLIELEITETAFMSDLAAAAATLRQLRNLGLHISLDDFGTGYSSLSYLKQLPIDSLKIDSRFVKDFNETREGVALVSAIVGMAHGLGIRVIAEGVESAESLALLKQLGCDEVQGFVISPPLPAREASVLAGTEFPVAAKHLAAARQPTEAIAAG
jgi:diguanylate cyclase (GGDEF)-like protein